MPDIHFFTALLLMAGITYLIRVLPLILIRRPMHNRFLRSFFFYVPYAVLAAMVFPTIIYTTAHPVSGICALFVCIILSLFRRSLLTVAIGGALTVLAVEGIYYLL